MYRFDPLLLATKDKSCLIDHKHKKLVWRPAAHVNAVLLVCGRIPGTWRYDRKAKGLNVSVVPFSNLSGPVARATETQAAAIAKFLEMPLADFQIKRASHRKKLGCATTSSVLNLIFRRQDTLKKAGGDAPLRFVKNGELQVRNSGFRSAYGR